MNPEKVLDLPLKINMKRDAPVKEEDANEFIKSLLSTESDIETIIQKGGAIYNHSSATQKEAMKKMAMDKVAEFSKLTKEKLDEVEVTPELMMMAMDKVKDITKSIPARFNASDPEMKKNLTVITNVLKLGVG
jgi:hypothetical protein